MTTDFKSTNHGPNPLIPLIIPLLRQHPHGISEYQLINQLQTAGFSFPWSDEISGELQLFRKHFLVMNALYRLQPILLEEGLELQISPLNIRLIPRSPSEDGATLPGLLESQPLRDYYLDWSEFANSNDAEVQRLLASFWQRYFCEDRRLQALTTLQLPADCDWSQIRMAYRRLAARHHPDRGGDGARFHEIREAYELLASAFADG